MGASAILATHRGSARLAVVGTLDARAVQCDLGDLDALLDEEGVSALEVDLAGVRAIDSAGAAWLLRLARSAPGAVRLTNPSPLAARALQALGLAGLLVPAARVATGAPPV